MADKSQAREAEDVTENAMADRLLEQLVVIEVSHRLDLEDRIVITIDATVHHGSIEPMNVMHVIIHHVITIVMIIHLVAVIVMTIPDMIVTVTSDLVAIIATRVIMTPDLHTPLVRLMMMIDTLQSHVIEVESAHLLEDPVRHLEQRVPHTMHQDRLDHAHAHQLLDYHARDHDLHIHDHQQQPLAPHCNERMSLIVASIG